MGDYKVLADALADALAHLPQESQQADAVVSGQPM